MKYEANFIDQLLVYMLTIAFALAILLTPQPVMSGAYVSGGNGYHAPRWSNEHQLQQGLIAHPDCVTIAPAADANYIPGRDAYGNPVPPADTVDTLMNPLPNIGFDVKLGEKHVGDKTVKLYADGYGYDPVTNQFTLYGQPMQRDCLPWPK